MQLFPAIDILDGRCVRLVQGRFDAATVYAADPLVVAAGFAAAGASALHIVDLAGSRDGREAQAALIRRLAAGSGLALQVGGGIRSLAAAEAYAEAGVARVVVGSLAASDPAEAARILTVLGPDRVTLALDVRPSADGTAAYRLAVAGWTETSTHSPWQVLEAFLAAGGRDVLCTDISRDGMLAGPSLDLYAWMRRLWPDARLLASGGIAALADLAALRRLGMTGAVVGKALYEGRFRLEDALATAAAPEGLPC